jgi:hypothetical protein
MRSIISSAFLQWRTASDLKPLMPPGLPGGQYEPLANGTDLGISLSDLVTLAIGRHDVIREERESSRSRAYQLLSFNAASSMLLVGGMQFLWERIAGAVLWVVVAMLLLVLYLSAKATIHCLHAVRAQPVGELPPLFRSSAVALMTTPDSGRRVAVEMLDSLERLYEPNDRARALCAEHSDLAVRTTMVYSVMVVLTLVVVAVGGFCQAADKATRQSSEQGRGIAGPPVSFATPAFLAMETTMANSEWRSPS